MKINSEIDFVITWVDGDDPIWKKDKEKYLPKDGDNRKSRFRDWEQLKYWFRAVEKYAPWVNKIHFVTYGHLPEWLNVKNPKLHIVKHTDFIPEKYLPVFNSTAIEIHLHRIPTLSNQFVYFCDDFYLMKPCKPEDFFKKGKPVDMAEIAAIRPHNNEMYYYHLYNDYSLYREYMTNSSIIKNLFKYFNLKYGMIAVTNLLNLITRNIYFRSLHLPVSYLRTTMEKLWNDYPEILEKTATSRFRQITNNSPELFRGYQLITGNFYPINKKGIILDTRDVLYARLNIENSKYKLMCLSDNSDDKDFESHKQQINKSFEIVFPERSSFEQES